MAHEACKLQKRCKCTIKVVLTTGALYLGRYSLRFCELSLQPCQFDSWINHSDSFLWTDLLKKEFFIIKTTFCFNMKSLLFFKEVKSCHWKPDCYVLNRWKILGTSVVSRSCFIDLSCPFLSAQWWKRCNHLTFHKGQHEKLKGLNIDNVCALTDISHLLWALRQKKKKVLHQRKGESPLDISTLWWRCFELFRELNWTTTWRSERTRMILPYLSPCTDILHRQYSK